MEGSNVISAVVMLWEREGSDMRRSFQPYGSPSHVCDAPQLANLQMTTGTEFTMNNASLMGFVLQE